MLALAVAAVAVQTTFSYAAAAGGTTASAPVLRSGGAGRYLVDARSAPVHVTVYATNLAALRRDYASLLLPFAVRRAGTRGTAMPLQYLTDATGRADFALPAGARYEISVARGGVFATRASVRRPAAPRLYATVTS